MTRATAALIAITLVVFGSTPSAAQECQVTTLSFTFAADPQQPRVGDTVELTFGLLRNSIAGLPSFSLAGSAPLFAGNLTPDPPVSMSGPVPAQVTYRLTAVAAGAASLQLSVFYEGVVGCGDDGQTFFGFRSATSPPFTVEIADVATPTATPTSTSTPLPTPTSTPAGTASASSSPTTSPAPPSSGGCATGSASSSLAWLVALFLLAAAGPGRRRKRRLVASIGSAQP